MSRTPAGDESRRDFSDRSGRFSVDPGEGGSHARDEQFELAEAEASRQVMRRSSRTEIRSPIDGATRGRRRPR